jgi:hypothetical protein
MAARTITVEHNGTTYYGQVARIKSTLLGQEDHGILTAYLHCEGDGWGIGVGGYGLDAWTEAEKRRVPTAYGLDQIVQFIHTAGVGSWEKLPGTEILVLFESKNSLGGIAAGIAHIRDEDRVLILKEHAEQWQDSLAEAVRR